MKGSILKEKLKKEDKILEEQEVFMYGHF